MSMLEEEMSGTVTGHVVGSTVHYQPMMELRWFRTKFGRHNNCILQQAWRGSDGSVDWRPINVVDADG